MGARPQLRQDMEKERSVDKVDKEVLLTLAGMTRLAVVGTGNYGRALRAKLIGSGAEVVWGSRRPGDSQVTVEAALQESLVILAVPVFSWPSLPLASLQPGSVVMDCSNRKSWCRPEEISQAEQLRDLLPAGVKVVKCLNTVSAYELENSSLSPGKQVPLAGDCPEAKRVVSELLDKMGFHFSDMGPLSRARDIENMPLYLFVNWRLPLAVSTRNLSPRRSDDQYSLMIGLRNAQNFSFIKEENINLQKSDNNILTSDNPD